MQRKLILGVAGILGAVLLIWGFAFATPYELHGSEITSKVPAPAVNLTRADGSSFELSGRKGRIVLVFFGYTSCPDVCPTTLADMKRIKADLGERAAEVDFVFITVDPQRDTPERVQAYASGFSQDFIGLSGSEGELEPVWQGYGVFRKIQESQSAAGYLVDHSARVYLVDKTNQLRVTYTYGTPVEDMANDIRYLLKEN
ncbi:MAG: SCO family protein [Bellilinea sp.]